MIKITVIGSERVAARLEAMPDRIREVLYKAILGQWYGLQAHVVQDKLSGQVLKRRTGNLASSIHVGGTDTLTTIIQTPQSIVATVGTKVRYARIHEYGGVVNVRAHARKSVLGKTYQVRAHQATYPERSFLRSSILDRASQIRDAIQSAVQVAVKEVAV